MTTEVQLGDMDVRAAVLEYTRLRTISEPLRLFVEDESGVRRQIEGKLTIIATSYEQPDEQS
jgi:hypothetical protein